MKYVFADYTDPYNTKYLKDEEDLKIAINLNTINKYKKIPLLKVGDFVTCCHIDDSIEPDSYRRGSYNDYSWEEEKTIQINKVGINRNVYYIMGSNAEAGVYVAGVRFATEKEIETFKHNKK